MGSSSAQATSPAVPTTTTTTPSSTNYSFLIGHFAILIFWSLSQYIYIPYPVHLLGLVTAILYVSCHQSLILAPYVHEAMVRYAHKQHEEQQRQSPSSSAPPLVVEPRETLRKEDAYQFPIVGSFALFGLYLAFKYLDKDWVNLLIGGYFSIAGVIAMTITFTPYLEWTIWAPNRSFGWNWIVHHSLPDWVAGPSPWDLGFDVSFSNIVSFLVAVMVITLYFASRKAWFLNNILAISFCLQGVRNFSVGSFQIAAILLIGLFFYDIFWVFGTEVMVKVATNLDGPIKILLPRESLEKDPETGRLNLSLLGLGDIVIPGFFLALMLRFDFHQCVQKRLQQQQQQKNTTTSSSSTTTTVSKQRTEPSQPPPPPMELDLMHVEHSHFPKPYFHSTLVGYVLGLGTTLWVMFQFKAAQPALLYLVPACLGSSFGCAVLRGEVKALLEYTEEEPEEEGEEEAKDGESTTQGSSKEESKKNK